MAVALVPAGAGAAVMPERPAPAGFASVNGGAGGRTLAGTFTGNAKSAAAVLGGVLGALRVYFDGAPVVSGAVGDPADRGIMGFFDARLRGAPVRGVVFVQLNDGGGGGVAVVFDSPADLPRSFPAMARQLGAIQVPGGGPGQGPTLQQQTTPDGKAAIGVPAGWRITGYGNGAVDVSGPQGQAISVGIYLPILVQPTFVGPVAGAIYLPFIADPAAAVRPVSEALGRQTPARGGPVTTDMQVLERYNTPPPLGAGQAAYLVARSRVGGRPYLHFAALKMRQTGEILRSAARGQSEAYDRANKGFSYYLRGVEALEHTPSGRRGNFDRDFADAVVKADPTKYRLVPPSQYRIAD
jgi:hypothetical protein